MPRHKRRTGHEQVRASFTLGLALYARWGACAALSGCDRGTFAVRALEQACAGLYLIDKRKPADQVKISDRPVESGPVSPDGPDDAA